MPFIKPKDFTSFYSQFYFDNDISIEIKKHYGILTDLDTGSKVAENHVKSDLLDKGLFNKYALAWKSGKLAWNSFTNEFAFKDSFFQGNSYLNGYGSPIDINDFNAWCNRLNSIENERLVLVNKASLYKDLQENAPRNIGPVYIITSLFFKSHGRFPIYDQFAHKAIRALALNLGPDEIYLGDNPGKSNVKKVMCMYNEYITLLEKVFPNEINTDGDLFISRSLDQALWVYGHCTKPWHKIKE